MTSIRNDSSDLRVRKSIRDIQRALLELIAKKSYKDIRVNDVIREALVTKKTFYRHFSSLDAVLDSVRQIRHIRNFLTMMNTPIFLRN